MNLSAPQSEPGEASRPEPPVGPLRFDLVNVALATAVVVIVLQAFRFLSLIQNVLVLVVLAVILATAIEPLVFAMRRRGLQRGAGVLIIYLAFISVLATFVVLAAQVVGEQLAALMAALPELTFRLRAFALTLPAGPIRDVAVAFVANLNVSAATGLQGLPSILTTGTLSGLVFATLSVVETVFAIVTVLVIAYFWVAERLVIRRVILRFIRPDRRQRVYTVWENVERKLGGWARGQLLLMVVVGVIQGIGYTVIGVHFGVLLAVYAGLAEIVPLVGPYLGAVPALLVALSQSPSTALLVVAYTVGVNLVESNILVPRIMQRAVGLSPLTVILALLAGAALYGVMGAFLSVPIAAAIQAALVELAPTSSPPTETQKPSPGTTA